MLIKLNSDCEYFFFIKASINEFIKDLKTNFFIKKFITGIDI